MVKNDSCGLFVFFYPPLLSVSVSVYVSVSGFVCFWGPLLRSIIIISSLFIRRDALLWAIPIRCCIHHNFQCTLSISFQFFFLFFSYWNHIITLSTVANWLIHVTSICFGFFSIQRWCESWGSATVGVGSIVCFYALTALIQFVTVPCVFCWYRYQTPPKCLCIVWNSWTELDTFKSGCKIQWHRPELTRRCNTIIQIQPRK